MSQTPPQPTPSRTTPSRVNAPAGISWGWWTALGLLIVAIVAIAGFILADNGEPLTTTSVADVVAEPAEHTGDRIAVAGRIEQLLTDRAVAIGSDLAADELLVLFTSDATIRGYGTTTVGVMPVPAGEFYEVGDVAQFAGEVREFDRDTLAEEFDLVLNEELFGEWEARPVLVMDRLDVATLGQLAPAPTLAPA